MRSRGLIINGVSAPEDRYPYSASLQYNSEHFCGGSLVAPDFVVTAAHCTSSPSKITLGRYDLDDLSDYDFEVMDVVEAFVHPGYNKETVDNDIALLMLERQSIHPYVKLNADSDVPTKSDDLRVKGWGDIDPSDNGQLTSDELRETTVTYIPNEICEQSEGYVVTNNGALFGSYKGTIKDTMLCALDDIGQTSDACQGDSGGGLIKRGKTAAFDTLIGIVSWGYGCADPNFPGVYSRISEHFETFLKPTICANSRSPPPYLKCFTNNVASTLKPTTAPVPVPDGLLTIEIQTDPYHPEDLGWELLSVPANDLIQSRPIGFYTNRFGVSVSEEVVVQPERFYRLTIHDKLRNGFKGRVTVFAGRRHVLSDALVYEPGFSSISGASVTHGFFVGDSPPRELTLYLSFDNKPEEVAWSIESVADDLLPLGFKWFGWYNNGFSQAMETIPVYGRERGTQKYTFSIFDKFKNGLCCSQGEGSYSLFLGESLIASGSQFGEKESHIFEIDAFGKLTFAHLVTPNAAAQPTSRPTNMPKQHISDSSPLEGDFEEELPLNPVMPSNVDETDSWYNDIPSKLAENQPSNQSGPTSEQVSDGLGNQLISENIELSPVTGTFMCSYPGLTCTMKCLTCDTVKIISGGITQNSPDQSTIIFTVQRGTKYNSDSPSFLTLVESDRRAANSIKCDVGCSCSRVNNQVLGCGLIGPSTQTVYNKPSPMEPQHNSSNALASILPLGLLVLNLIWTTRNR